MMAFIQPVSHCPVYYTAQVIAADLVSHPKASEIFRKSRGVNQIHFMRFQDEKLTDENPSPLSQINKMQLRIRC